jgi:hypothetical protein
MFVASEWYQLLWFILVVGLKQLSTIISPAQSQSFRRKESDKIREVCTLKAYLQLSTWENCPSNLLVNFSAAASTLPEIAIYIFI